MDDELDLIHYLDIALRYWWLALLCLGVGLGAAYWSARNAPIHFEASTLVTTAAETTKVSYTTALTTSSEWDNSREGREQRQASYLQLAKSSAVAEEVIATLGEALPPRYRQPAVLAGMASGSMVGKSDLLEITITGDDRDLVRQIAAAWGPAFVHQVTRLYDATDESLNAVEEELRLANEALALHEAAYEAHLRSSPLERDQARLRELEDAAADLYATQALYAQDLAAELVRVAAWLRQARGLAEHLQASESEDVAATLLPALMSLKMQVYGAMSPSQTSADAMRFGLVSSGTGSASSPQIISLDDAPQVIVSLQSDASVMDMPLAELQADLQLLIDGLETRRDEISSALTLSMQSTGVGLSSQSAVVGPSADVLAKIEERAAALRAEVNRENRQRRGLLAERDLAQETLSNLQRKQAELILAARTSGSPVRLASAEPTVHRVPADTTKSYALAAVLGVAMSALLAAGNETARALRQRRNTPGLP